MSNFSWIQTHKELAEYLKDKEDEQKELVDLLREAGVTAGLVDEEPKGNRFDLEEIDPFSFFCFIYKYGPDKRLQILQNIATELDLHYPEDELGIPSAQAQKVMMFPFKDGRNDNEIENLWQFFYSALDDSITDDQFESILNQYGVGPVKITEALFYIDPENYFPIDGPTKPYLKQVLGVDPNFSTWQEYLDVLNKIKKKTDQPFYEISYKAWVWLEEQKRLDKKYQIFQELLDRYKQFLKDEGIEEERYKWEAIHHFLQTFDTEADDFTENFKVATSKAANLVYQNSIGFIRKAVTYYPEDVRGMFKALYDESKPLQERYQEFVEASEELLPKVIETHGKQLNHQQDERTISYYLTMRYPDKYPLYKNETYQYLISLFDDQDAKPAGEKLFHYLELAEDLVPVIESDGDVIDMVEDQLTEECYQGEQQWLVFQDVLWINVRKSSNSDIWNYDRKWVELLDTTIKINDKKSVKKFFNSVGKIIKELGATGNDNIVYNSSIDSQIQLIVGSRYVVRIRRLGEDVQLGYYVYEGDLEFITEKYPERMVSDKKVDVEGDSFVWVDFPAGKVQISEFYNTLFKVAEAGLKGQEKSQFRSIYENKHNSWIADVALNKPLLEELLKDFYLVGSTWQGSENVEQLSRFIDESIWENGYDDRFSEMVNEIRSGDKIAIKAPIIIRGNLKIKARGIVTENKKNGKVVEVEWEDGFEAFEVPFTGGYGSTIHFVEDAAHIGAIWYGVDTLSSSNINDKSINNMKSKYPLNTIFYGPPGTGKTYTTIKRAAEIVEGRAIEDYNEAKQIFNSQLGETIEFITFHQNYSYEDFIQGLRPDTENDKELTFDRVDGLFKELADKALKNYEASKRPQTKKKSFEEVFNTFIDPLVQGEVEEIEVEMKKVSYYITAVTNRSIEFRKASGGTQHTLSISTLKRMYEAESVLEIQGLSSYYSPLLEKLLDKGKSPGETETVERKNYVLIIDEINRANISRVFGELITLIEPDKRYGRDMHIPAKLPSGETFSVPENLYIIGTMNTADKSIALLDIALRRRFEFEAMYPKYEINGELIHDVDVLRKINERIVKLKGHDFQIGHSYFMKNHMTLKQRMNRRVIPLLLEYFMNDEDEVKQILEHAGLTIIDNSWPLEISGRA